MKIHIISNVFHPDELAGAALFTDLALYFKERGDDVRVTTTFSYYPRWKIGPEDRGVRLRDELYADIPVRRLSMYVPENPTSLRRILSDLSFLRSLVTKASARGWRPDVVLTALPMLSQCLAQRFLYVGEKVPRLIVVQDFVVDAALELGILKLPGLSGFLRWLERFALSSAKTVVTISPTMLDKLRANLSSRNRKLTMIPNWIHRSLQTEVERQAAFEHTREQKQLFYGGNLGVKQGLPDFVDTFRLAKSDWRLDIHGGGAEAERLREAVRRTPNVRIGGVLDESDYVGALLSASACVITQRQGVGANFLPSKLLPALATGTPVLAVCDAHSPLGQAVASGGFGSVIEPGNPSALSETLRAWAASPELLAEMSQKARASAADYSRQRILPLYEKELLDLIA